MRGPDAMCGASIAIITLILTDKIKNTKDREENKNKKPIQMLLPTFPCWKLVPSTDSKNISAGSMSHQSPP